jgi:AcrR family transcriptional regulator
VAGRPRSVEDAVILRAAVEVIGRVGPSGLTLAAVAREVGLVAATLVQRFGSKRGLLLALAERSAIDTGPFYERVRERHRSPLKALRAVVVESMAPMDSPKSFANHLAFLCLDLTDPELHLRALAVHNAHQHGLRGLLDDAVATGELRADTDTTRLARSVRAMTAGAGLVWALDREGSLTQRLQDELDVLVAPHTNPARDEHPKEHS